MDSPHPLSPEEALLRLMDGNRRFFSHQPQRPHTDSTRLALAAGSSQFPHAYATVLSCSDSRVPVEIIFDAGIMDIFVIRVAGNLCGNSVLASVEYGLAHVKTPVLVVLGHTDCGAVTAAVSAHTENLLPSEHHIPPLLARLTPAVRKALLRSEEDRDRTLVALGVEENVRMEMEEIFRKSPTVNSLVQQEKVLVVGAVYDLETGRVNWLD